MPDASSSQFRTIVSSMLIPLLFVFLWSTGFIGAKYGLPYADPLTFLFIRMWLAAVIFYLAASTYECIWPDNLLDVAHVSVVGVLFHALYLGGVFVAISRGTDAGFAALIVSLQPLLTVVLAFVFLAEPLSASKLTGVALGLLGVCLVLAASATGQQFSLHNLLVSSKAESSGLVLCLWSLLAISAGTIYQKRFCFQIDLLPSMCIQYVAASAALLLMAQATEPMAVQWRIEFTLTLIWLVLALSLGAVLLLMWLIRRDNAGNVASLFYLVPPFTAIEAWLLFGETMSQEAIAGLLLSAVGVALVVRKP